MKLLVIEVKRHEDCNEDADDVAASGRLEFTDTVRRC